MAAQKDESFLLRLNQADIRVADGTGIIWAQWYVRSAFWPLWPSLIAFMWRDTERITGMDSMIQLARLAHEAKLSLYLLGGTPTQVSRTAAALRQRWPGLTVFVGPDHRFAMGGPAEVITDIQTKQPALLFVAYGASKQTRWIEEWRSQLPSVRIAVGVGGAFAMMSESRPRAPRFLRKHNLEWLWRLLLEPERLPRIWQATVRFPLFIRSLRLKEL